MASGNNGKGNGHVMLVDDEEFVRKYVSRVVSKMGIRISSFACGLDALNFYKDHAEDVDLVITDMKMPVMDGRALFQEVRKINANARVVLASGFALEDAVNKCMQEGAVEFLSKPFTLDELTQVVQTCIS